FGREEHLDRLSRRREPGFDALACARELRCRLAAVLVSLAEQPLAVYCMEPAPPEPVEPETESIELSFLVLHHPQYDLGRRVVTGVLEDLLDTPQRTGARLCELVLAEVDQLRVVEVNRRLVRHEVAHQRVAV